MKARLYRLDCTSQTDVYGLGKESVGHELERLNELSDKGDVRAMTALGIILLDGRDAQNRPVERDCARGCKLLTEAAARDDVNAMVFLGHCYFLGHYELDPDREKSKALLEKAALFDCAEGKYALACFMLGSFDEIGNEKQAFALMECAASYGLIEARLRLADLYFRGHGVKRSDKKAVAILEELSEAGVPEASYELSGFYGEKSSIQSQKKVIYYLEKACAGGITAAYEDLGQIYEQGKGTDKDPGRALSIYRRYHDVEPDNSDANFKIAELLLFSGASLEEAYKDEGLERLKQAAAKNHPGALVMEACFHMRGLHGFEKSEKAARELFLAAGETGSIKTLVMLGRMYRDGTLFAEDPGEALKYFLRAADDDDEEAFYELGCMYRDGDGVEKDSSKALTYFEKSATQGSPFGSFEYGRMLLESDDARTAARGRLQMTKAANRGLPEAMQFLRDLLMRGDDAASYNRERAYWYGHAFAAVNFAIMYEANLPYRPAGTLMEPEQAFRILKSAAAAYDFASGDERTYIFCALGRCHEGGVGCRANLKTALRLYETGMRLRDPNAFLSMSRLYRAGEGVVQDTAKADELFRTARSIMEKKNREMAQKSGKEPEKENRISAIADFVFRVETPQ